MAVKAKKKSKKKPVSNRGGKRAGAGRKAENGAKKMYSVRLTDVEHKKILFYFGGLTPAVRSLL